ncbi:MAG: hypothetical protein LDLANPLL_01291 [Turneriella sp.]|nr:hypothetical protein [Turneriella sp.]
MELRKISLTLPAGIRLDKFLFDALNEKGEGLSRSRIQSLIEEGNLLGLGAAKTKPSYKAKEPVAIEIHLPSAKEVALKPLKLKIPVLYEDKYLAVVHKPQGMTVHPGAGTADDTLVHALLHNIDTLSPSKDRPGIVHRLDRETEGVMLIAKTEGARERLSEAFAERKISKTYEALVWGKVTLPKDVSGFIWRDIHDRKKMRFGENIPERVKRARSAELLIEEEEPLKHATRLKIKLITGRTHQIRTTCAYFNAPIIGDTLYGKDVEKIKLYKLPKATQQKIFSGGMMLVARSLTFTHPFLKKKLTCSIDLPEKFLLLRDALG